LSYEDKVNLPPFLYNLIIRPRFSIRRYVKRILEKEITFKEGKIIDFGCGTGSLCFLFPKKGYLGIDTSKERIMYAKRRFKNYNFSTITNNKLPVEKKSVDLICIVAVLHHINDENCKAYVKEFSRILKPKGKIVCIEPCLLPNIKFNNWFMKTMDDGDYIRDKKAYSKLFEKHFKIKVHKIFRKYVLYNEIFFSTRRKK